MRTNQRTYPARIDTALTLIVVALLTAATLAGLGATTALDPAGPVLELAAASTPGELPAGGVVLRTLDDGSAPAAPGRYRLSLAVLWTAAVLSWIWFAVSSTAWMIRRRREARSYRQAALAAAAVRHPARTQQQPSPVAAS